MYVCVCRMTAGLMTDVCYVLFEQYKRTMLQTVHIQHGEVIKQREGDSRRRSLHVHLILLLIALRIVSWMGP